MLVSGISEQAADLFQANGIILGYALIALRQSSTALVNLGFKPGFEL
jgi:hypothetical protein